MTIEGPHAFKLSKKKNNVTFVIPVDDQVLLNNEYTNILGIDGKKLGENVNAKLLVKVVQSLCNCVS